VKKERIILGIDPGTNIMGYGVVKCVEKDVSLVVLDILKLSKYENHALKLRKIFETTLRLIEEYKPDECAFEAPFFGKNVQSMLKLGRAQGVAMAASLYRDIPIFEYAPRKIKQSITGNGSSSKEQVAKMLQNILHFTEMPKELDATDGLAVAVCHFYQGNTIEGEKKYSGWKSFVSNNPNKVK
jgi:crossover junction endodeoxyribonuclease RuvC